MLLNDIKKVLRSIDPIVFYGLTPPRIYNEQGREVNTWDYTTFNRTRLKSATQKTSYADAFEVHIVREDFIPEGVDVEVIEKLTALPGVKLASEDGVYDYTMKPGTDHVVEMLTLTFVRVRK